MRDIDMSTKYNPTAVEAGRYDNWQSKKLFAPESNQEIQGNEPEPYSIVIPPPNVTGKLHLGHAWDTTLQDMIIRQKRMQGFDTLWLPGMDHAGIATQAKVEQRLRGEGISRYDLGREKFVAQVWDWKNEYATTIKQQWGKMGLSLDFDRERFTLDEGLNKAVNKVFIDLYNKGLIYRGEYIINWDPQARTALSDIEVIYQDDEGAFYHVKYPFTDGTTFNGKNYIEIATTRPETMFGDVAVAVHPSDERYKDLIGKTVMVPLVGREIPIIADEYVEKDFGTGMVKITPAHDPNDFQVGNRHDLERINTMTEDGHLNEHAGKYNGMERFEARKAIVADLEAGDYMLKVDPIVHSVGHSERTGVPVESRLSTQWFVKMAPLAKQILDMQQHEDEKVEFVPARFEDTFTHWMENIRDWVISRQLWWGHQIPAWYKNKGTDNEEIYVGTEAPEGDGWERDPDVLDTWFSSALWPFSTMGWPEKMDGDFARYYPTNTLVTGYDIIFFWVARMMFQGKEFTGQRPFKNVLIHGLIRDGEGRKMSKSLGNGVDPMDVIEKYGADALRWFLATGLTPGQDVRFTYDKMDAAWNFINKIWNASRYVIMNLAEDTPSQLPDLDKLTLADQWILARLNTTVADVTRNFDKFEFGEAGRSLYNFIWNDFADWYIEMTKETLNGDGDKAPVQQTLAYVLDQTLRLLQPIMPFVTEAIWQEMPDQAEKNADFAITRYPVVHDELTNDAAETAFKSLQDLIVAVRNIRSEANAPMSTAIDLLIKTNDDNLIRIFNDNADYINRFAHPKSLTIAADVQAPDLAMSQVITGAEIYVPLAELIDIDDEIARLEGETKKFSGEVKRAQGKLSNEKFVNAAPEAVVAAEREKLADWQAKLAATQERLTSLRSAK
ncbi:valine--tRNA ligase [Leuconostoc pseudomesenteroides]|uniref:Valine--tRNA ligase n=1 Tax=Leuconostoc pseudomesenteroides TaxID=33968 RepID=A0A1X0VDH3_LEUPS|nr:valine--tRNA ligase [Leuconostoc pseudomesenteroides]OQJ71912.1 valine--tRNA ligase [Leuconostoc pseudomesenteroides]OQJ77304.1 valine--tRNA ligase [Leuconostoc pseudomesenteroides]OQJ77764.1 valine--tRNA ligase [Leuconostoc pseudomesenteroides]ORI36808.1 valine--tRNA ligase [Leuconostoc pseudomesenteroides]ORI45556.1 valine--tRNA ligase [Leuconostoc pseudomesenteroides]